MAKKWVDKVIINISRVSDRMVVNKVFVQRIIISLISDLTVCAAQCGLDDSQKCCSNVKGEINFNYSWRL